MILYGLIIAIHVIASLVLILVILLQAGRGGGLSEAFGGGQSQTIFGTSAPTFLTRATTASAIVFLSSCLILAIMSGKKSQSVMEKETLKSNLMAPLQEKQKTLPDKTQSIDVNKAVDQTKAAQQAAPVAQNQVNNIKETLNKTVAPANTTPITTPAQNVTPKDVPIKK